MFSEFTSENDPHGERDFGAFEHNRVLMFWKIDYYDTTLSNSSEELFILLEPQHPRQSRLQIRLQEFTMPFFAQHELHIHPPAGSKGDRAAFT